MSTKCQRRRLCPSVPIADPKRALFEVRTFPGALMNSERIYNQLGGPSGQPYWNALEWKNQERLINENLPLIERIASELDSDLGARVRLEDTIVWPHHPKVSALEEIIGRLQNVDKEAAIFQPKGPQLAAKDLHPWIWNAGGRQPCWRWPLVIFGRTLTFVRRCSDHRSLSWYGSRTRPPR